MTSKPIAKAIFDMILFCAIRIYLITVVYVISEPSLLVTCQLIVQ